MYRLIECKRGAYLAPDQLERELMSVRKGMPNQELYLMAADGKPMGTGMIEELVVRDSRVMKGDWDMRKAPHVF